MSDSSADNAPVQATDSEAAEESNLGVPEEEIEAALHEIEQAAGTLSTEQPSSRTESDEGGDDARDAAEPREERAGPRPGDTSVSNALLDEEELAAAMAAIQAMAPDELENIPDLDGPSGPTPADDKADSQPEGEAAEASQAADGSETQQSETSDEPVAEDRSPSTAPGGVRPGDVPKGNALLDDEELAKALAEIENSPQEADSIPDLDDGNRETSGDEGQPQTDASQASTEPAGDAVDNELAEALAEIESISSQTKEPAERLPRDEQEPEHTGAQVEPQSDEAEAAAQPPAKKGPRFKIGSKKAESGQSDGDGGTAGSEADDAEQTAPMPLWAKRLLRGLDHVLETVNQPFSSLSRQTRNLIGWTALATIVVSLMALVLTPVLMPQRDAVTFLREKVQQLEQQAAAGAGEAATEETDGAESS